MSTPWGSSYFINQCDRIGKTLNRITYFKSILILNADIDPSAMQLNDQFIIHEKEGIIIRMILRYIISVGSCSNVKAVNDDILKYLLDHMNLTCQFWKFHNPNKQTKEYEDIIQHILGC